MTEHYRDSYALGERQREASRETPQRDTTGDADPKRHKVVAVVDFSNAFNSADRDFLLLLIKVHCPQLYNFCRWLYANESALWTNVDNQVLTMPSSQGCQQGCAVSNILWSVLMWHIKCTTARPGLDMHVAYWDDLVISGDADAVASSIKDIMEMAAGSMLTLGKATQLRMNFAKVNVHCVNECAKQQVEPLFDDISADIKVQGDLNITFLKAPIGVDLGTGYEFVRKTLDEKLEDLKCLAHKIGVLEHAHEAYDLLKTCATACRVVHLTRTLPPAHHEEFILQFDNVLKDTLERLFLMGGKLPDARWQQARLPHKHTGIGCSSGVVTSVGQWVTSVLASAKQVRGVTGLEFDGVQYCKHTIGQRLHTALDGEYDVDTLLQSLSDDLETRYDEQDAENTNKHLDLSKTLLKSAIKATRPNLKAHHNLPMGSTESTPLSMLSTVDPTVPGLRTKSAVNTCDTLGQLLQLHEARRLLHGDALSNREKTILAMYNHSSNAWLECVPFEFKGPGQRGWNLKAGSWRALARQRLGISAVKSLQQCTVCRGHSGPMDVDGYHAHQCRDKGNLYWRHEQLVAALVFHLRLIFGYDNVTTDPKEGRGPYRTTKKCPGDIVIKNWKDGVTLLIDCAVVSPMAYEDILRRDGPGGAATHYAERYKVAKYSEFSWDGDNACPYMFRPFVMETTGALGTQALSFINELRQITTEKFSAYAGRDPSKMTQDLEVDINMAVVKHIGMELMRRARFNTSNPALSEAAMVDMDMRRARANRFSE